MTISRLLPALFLFASVWFVGSAPAEETAEIDRERLAEIATQVRTARDFAERYAACPADVFQADRPFWRTFIAERDVERAECEKDPADCLARCAEGLSGEACFALARALQDNLDEEQHAGASQFLFTQACALGRGGGCTNRGAGIRNGFYADDPFDTRSDSERSSCWFRSFDIACREEDAWGCAMLGQAYHHGEGTPRDTAEARRFYRQSCDLNPAFVACDFARDGMDTLDLADDAAD